MARDQYWYFGKFRDFAAFVFGNSWLHYTVDADLEYSPPCSGCSNCYRKQIRVNEPSNFYSRISQIFSFRRNPG